MLDTVVLAMGIVMLTLGISFYFAKYARQFKWHRNIQLTLTILLSLTIVLFEIDVRFFTDWRMLAEPSPYLETGWVDRALWIHLGFAIPTPFLWGYVVLMALKKIEWESEQYRASELHRASEQYRAQHRRWGWLASLFMLGTTLTGWTFYWLAFVAE